MLLRVGVVDVFNFAIQEARSALPDAPVRPEAERSTTAALVDRARRWSGAALRRLADRVEPPPAGTVGQPA